MDNIAVLIDEAEEIYDRMANDIDRLYAICREIEEAGEDPNWEYFRGYVGSYLSDAVSGDSRSLRSWIDSLTE